MHADVEDLRGQEHLQLLAVCDDSVVDNNKRVFLVGTMGMAVHLGREH